MKSCFSLFIPLKRGKTFLFINVIMSNPEIELTITARGAYALYQVFASCKSLSNYLRIRIDQTKMVVDCLNPICTTKLKARFLRGFFERYDVMDGYSYSSWFDSKQMLSAFSKFSLCTIKYIQPDNCLMLCFNGTVSNILYRVPMLDSATMRDPSGISSQIESDSFWSATIQNNSLHDAFVRLRGVRADAEPKFSTANPDCSLGISFTCNDDNGATSNVIINDSNTTSAQQSILFNSFAFSPKDAKVFTTLVKKLEIPQVTRFSVPLNTDQSKMVLQTISSTPLITLITSAAIDTTNMSTARTVGGQIPAVTTGTTVNNPYPGKLRERVKVKNNNSTDSMSTPIRGGGGGESFQYNNNDSSNNNNNNNRVASVNSNSGQNKSLTNNNKQTSNNERSLSETTQRRSVRQADPYANISSQNNSQSKKSKSNYEETTGFENIRLSDISSIMEINEQATTAQTMTLGTINMSTMGKTMSTSNTNNLNNIEILNGNENTGSTLAQSNIELEKSKNNKNKDNNMSEMNNHDVEKSGMAVSSGKYTNATKQTTSMGGDRNTSNNVTLNITPPSPITKMTETYGISNNQNSFQSPINANGSQQQVNFTMPVTNEVQFVTPTNQNQLNVRTHMPITALINAANRSENTGNRSGNINTNTNITNTPRYNNEDATNATLPNDSFLPMQLAFPSTPQQNSDFNDFVHDAGFMPAFGSVSFDIPNMGTDFSDSESNVLAAIGDETTNDNGPISNAFGTIMVSFTNNEAAEENYDPVEFENQLKNVFTNLHL